MNDNKKKLIDSVLKTKEKILGVISDFENSNNNNFEFTKHKDFIDAAKLTMNLNNEEFLCTMELKEIDLLDSNFTELFLVVEKDLKVK